MSVTGLCLKVPLFFLPHSSRAKAPQCLLTFDCSEIVSLPLRWTFGVINKSKTGKKSYRLSFLFLLLLPPITLTDWTVSILCFGEQLNSEGLVFLYFISSWLCYERCFISHDWQVTDKVQCQSNWRAFGKNKSINFEVYWTVCTWTFRKLFLLWRL